MRYFWATRPIMGLFATMLCLAGFRLQNSLRVYAWQDLLHPAIMTFIACSNAMLWNDYYDRERDRLKRKTLASDNKLLFYRVTIWNARLAGGVAAFFQGRSPVWFCFSLVMICLSLYYVRSYRIPGLSAVWVAVTAASPVAYSLTHAKTRHWTLGIGLFLLVLVAIFAREILKDLEDKEGDYGYKQTIPLVLGNQPARRVATAALFTGAFAVFLLSVGHRFCLAALLPFVCGLAIGPMFVHPKQGKLLIDISSVTLLVGILTDKLLP